MKIIKYVTAAAVTLAVISVSGTVGLGLFLDAKSDALIRKLESKIPGLEIRNVPADNGFISKKGRLYINYKGMKGIASDQEGIFFAVDYENYLGFLGVSGRFSYVPGFGNVSSIVQPYLKELPQIKGNYSASVFEGGASLTAATKETELPLDDGKCRISPLKLAVSANASLKADIRASLVSMNCEGDLLYAGRDAYSFSLQDLNLRINPEISGSAELVGALIELGAKKISGEASTIYMIGFKPEDEVRDPSLRDAFIFKEPLLSLKIEATGKKRLYDIYSAAQGSYSLGMPYVRDNTEQRMQSIDDLSMQASLKSADLYGLVKLISKGDLKALKNADGIFSDPLRFDLKKLDFKKDGGAFSMRGKASAGVAFGKIVDPSAEFTGTAGKNMIDRFCENGYENSLHSLLDKGYITQSADQYSLDLKYSDNGLYLNNRPVQEDPSQEESADDPDFEQLQQ